MNEPTVQEKPAEPVVKQEVKNLPKKVDKTLQNGEAKVVAETVAAIVSTKTYTQAAATLKISRTVLYERMDKYNLKEVIANFTQKAVELLQVNSIYAVEEFAKELEHNNVFIRREAAKEILDRIGLGKPTAPGTALQVNNTIKMPSQLSEEEASAYVAGRK